MPTLPHFKEYCVWLKIAKPAHITKETVSRLNVSHARLRIAKRFKGVRIEAVSPLLVRGYSVGMRILLIYSAAEAMGKAIGAPISTWRFSEESLNRQLRGIAEKMAPRTDVLKEHVRTKLAEFASGRDDNAVIVAAALRHLMAHGHFTPTGTSTLSKAGAEAIDKLSTRLLKETEKQFESWFVKAQRGD